MGDGTAEIATLSQKLAAVPKKGYFVLLRLYGPLEPFFDKTWRPSEIELV